MLYVTSSYVIVCLHTSPPFCMHGKNAQQLLLKIATNCLLVAQNDKATKKIRLGVKDLSEDRSCGQKRHHHKESWDHTLVYSKHVCGSKIILYQYFNIYSPFSPK